jgi:hypothetical protein
VSRIVCQFSCGAASAVATKLALAQYGDRCVIVNAFIKEEHEDNRRFLTDCEKWFGQPVVVLRDEVYGASAYEVFRRVRYINGPRGASCTLRIKRGLLDKWKQPGDVMVLGFTAEEQDRWDDFQERNPDAQAIAPLIERGLEKADCLAMVERAGIVLPAMYRMGYSNANCVGCVKAGAGYWRGIRVDFPEQFKAMAEIELSLDNPKAYLLRHRSGPLEGQRFPLAELPDGPIDRGEIFPQCGLFCETTEKEYSA